MTYVFAAIGVPGAAGTSAYGINDLGQIVGSYTDHAGHEHGFLDTNGTFSTIDVPNAARTVARGLNNLGDIVGDWFDKAGVEHGFLDDHGPITTIDVPGSLSTDAAGINDFGQIVGGYIAPPGGPPLPDGTRPQQASNAFEYHCGKFTTVAHGSNYGIEGVVWPYASGINDFGQIVGSTDRAPASVPYGWLYDQDHGTTPPYPPYPPYSALPAPMVGYHTTGINNWGQVVGWGQVSGSVGFVYANGHAARIDVPGATNTTVNGINDFGQIVGNSSNGAFVAAPDAALLNVGNVLGASKPKFITG